MEVKPFLPDDFIENEEKHGMMENVTKKELKQLAEGLGLAYDDAQIVFAKKLLNAYLLGK